MLQNLKFEIKGISPTWEAGDISKTIMLRCLSQKAFSYVKDSLLYPLPSERIIKHRLIELQVQHSIIDLSVNVLKQQSHIVAKLEKNICLMCDANMKSEFEQQS